MYKKFTYRRASKYDPGKVHIRIWNEPTTNKSLAALELLNEKLRLGEVAHWAKVLNFTSASHADYNWDRCSSTDKLKILSGIYNRRFLERSKMECHYCKRPDLFLQDPDRKQSRTDNLATTDHKVPLVEGPDLFDETNLLVSCAKCNNKKGSMSYENFLAKF